MTEIAEKLPLKIKPLDPWVLYGFGLNTESAKQTTQLQSGPTPVSSKLRVDE